jgi:hypothetical protein
MIRANCMRTIGLFIMFSLSGCSTSVQENDQSHEEHFVIDIFGCEYPIPSRYILNANGNGIHFYIRERFESDSSADEFLSGIDVLGYEAPPPASGFVTESVYKNSSLELFKISRGNYASYYLTDMKSQIFFSGSDLSESEIIALTNECVANQRSNG